MFEMVEQGGAAAMTNAALVEFRVALTAAAGADGPSWNQQTPDARWERIRVLEQLRAAVAAAQAREVDLFMAYARAAAQADVAARAVPGVGSRRRLAEAERAAAARVASARRESPSQASRFVGYAADLRADYPAAFAALAAGEVSERRIRTVHRVTSWLAPADRRRVDADLFADLAARMGRWGDGQVEREARTAAYRVDPKAACERVARAEAERAVTVRPAPEAMTWVTALLPLVQGVAVHAALRAAATAAKARGDRRSCGQIMADTLVARVTGQEHAGDVPIQIHLVMTDQTLRGDTAGTAAARTAGTAAARTAGTAAARTAGTAAARIAGTAAEDVMAAAVAILRDTQRGGPEEPARVVGYGPLPAGVARDVLLGTGAAGRTAKRAVRRLFTDPAGRLVAAESRSRTFTPAMAELIRVRDDTCRTPWCDASVAHVDHHEPHAHGGATAVTNGRGLCARCNLTQTTPGSVRPSAPAPDLPGRTRAPRPALRPWPTGTATVIDLVWTGPRHHAA